MTRGAAKRLGRQMSSEKEINGAKRTNNTMCLVNNLTVLTLLQGISLVIEVVSISASYLHNA